MKRHLSPPLPGLFNEAARGNRYISENSQDLKTVRTSSVDLIVTSPPFLDKVDYISDNWMRSWFLGLESATSSIELSVMNSLSEWEDFMRATLFEMGRVLRPGARAVVEVGEVKSRSVLLNLEQVLAGLLPIRVPGGELAVEEILINEQKFTKLSNCWDVKNNEKGTNTNRCLIVRKNLRKA